MLCVRSLPAAAALAVALLLPSVASAGSIPPPPDAKTCAKTRAGRAVPPGVAYDPKPGAVRVFAMQFKHEVRHVETYETFRTKVECFVREYVKPRLAQGRVNIVAFNEDIGLMTAGTGSRGATARRLISNPAGAPGCAGVGFPCATLATLGALDTGYAKELAAYRSRFPEMSPISGSFVAATDTYARGWMQTFSDIAKRYDVYILGSNNQAPFRESTEPADIDTFADPDLPRPDSVFVATSAAVYNEVFMWGPDDVRSSGAPMLRNVVSQNKKVPLTPIEQALQMTPGPATGPEAVDNVRPYRVPGTKARISFATSLPAFVYGDPPAGVDPCSDTSLYYMRCLDKLGANVVMQDEANPGKWTGEDGDAIEKWQPLSWMTSTWRAASDPTVSFDYNVTPHLVGNLADLTFDGQTAITQRALRGDRTCHYIGNASWIEGEDRPDLKDEAGGKTEFIAIAPWVREDGPRDALRSVGDKLAGGSGDELENDYVETAVVADLTFPRDPKRDNCVQDRMPDGPLPTRPVTLSVTPKRVAQGADTIFTFRARTRGKPLLGARVTFAGRNALTDREGEAKIRVKLKRVKSYRAAVTRSGYRKAATSVRVTASE
jgi:hypothetical protein